MYSRLKQSEVMGLGWEIPGHGHMWTWNVSLTDMYEASLGLMSRWVKGLREYPLRLW